MAKIIDLGVLQQEPLVFQMPPRCKTEIKEFTIAGEISTSFVMKMNKMYEDMNKENMNEMDKIKMMKQIVIEILKLDQENGKEVNMKFIDDNLDDIRYINIIIKAMMEHITEIQSDENLNSPQSK